MKVLWVGFGGLRGVGRRGSRFRVHFSFWGVGFDKKTLVRFLVQT